MASSPNVPFSPVPLSALSGIGRGKNWDAEENYVLAHAWIAAVLRGYRLRGRVAPRLYSGKSIENLSNRNTL